MSESLDLHCDGRPVARYTVRPELPSRLSPRPFLHPVRTLAGTVVTEVTPEDHAHHLGVSLAVPRVGDHNFWGGKTYLRDRGYIWLDDHGSQRHLAWSQVDRTSFTEALSWISGHGVALLEEERTVAVRAAGAGWALDFAYTLTNVTTAPLPLGSPAANGRAGAGYGGFFWRAPIASSPIDVLTPSGEGEAAAHGSHADWIALSGTARSGQRWSLIFHATDDPWFVRAREYPGVGTSLAWDRPLVLAPSERLARRVVTVVYDGRVTRQQAASLVGRGI